MLNSIIIMGRMTGDAELRTTSNGTSVTSFTVAVDRQFQKADAEKEEALDQAIAELGKEMSKAILMGNTEWQAELQAQYNALMEE